MRKKLRIAAWCGGGLLLAVALGASALYWAARQGPDFYRAAVRVDPARQRDASDEMLQRTTALVSDVRQEGRWEALFTADQVNGWLAVDLPANHADALPSSVRDPRVAIDPQAVHLACSFQGRGGSCVLSLTVEPSLPEPNVLAIRIRRVRAGLLPVPLNGILDMLSKAAGRMGLQLRWRYDRGDPVAVISIVSPRDGNDGKVRIESLRLAEGEIYLAGTTGS